MNVSKTEPSFPPAIFRGGEPRPQAQERTTLTFILSLPGRGKKRARLLINNALLFKERKGIDPGLLLNPLPYGEREG